MSKKRVTVNYAVWMTEIHEISYERSDFKHEEDWQAFLDAGDDDLYDYCDESSLVEETKGDCVNSSWQVHVEDINTLDQIEQALRD